MKPKVIEVLMAVYYGEKFVAEQIESILSQTYPHIRLTIRDNHSLDGTRQILEKYQSRHPETINVIYSDTNLGIIGNFSALLENSQADYVMFSDHDDVWLPHKVQIAMNKMEELEKLHGSETPILVHGDLKVVDSQLKTIHSSFWKYSKLDPNKQSLSRQLIHNQVTGCTTLLNRPLISLSTPFPQDSVMHDWWLALCAAAFGKIGVVNQPAILYRQHQSNDTGAKKYSLISFGKRFFNKPHRKRLEENRKKMFIQAGEFLKRFQSRLDESTKQILNAFLKFENATLIRKGYLMIKYRFFRVGFLRNLISLFRFNK